MKNLITMTLLILSISWQVQASSQNLPGIISDSKVESIICSEANNIQSNMAQMGFMIRNLKEMVNDFVGGSNSDHLEAIIMVDIQVLRTHLIAVMPKTPQKIKNIDPLNIQANKLIFQKYLLKMVQLTIDIEESLLKRPHSLEGEKEQRIKIAGLILKIDETVQEAHNLFRF